MPKIYLEYDDGHNGPRFQQYESIDDAIENIFGHDLKAGWNVSDYIEDFRGMFDENHDNYMGEVNNCGDRYSYIDGDIMRGRASEYLKIAERMDKNLSVYGKD